MTDWVRLWHDMPTDPKWRVIARKSGQPLPCVIAVFTMMMCNASGNAEKRGTLLAWDDEDAAAALDIDATAVSAIRDAMQGKVLDGDYLTGWERRQPRREDNSVGRVRAYRERKRTDGNAEERGVTQVKRNVTQRNAPETDADADTEEKAYAFSAGAVRLKPKDHRDWKKRFHAIPDFDAELHAMAAWVNAQPPEKQRKWFATGSAWMNKRHQEGLANRQRAGPAVVVGV